MKKKDKIKQLISEGNEHLKKQKLNIALNTFQQANNLDPDDPEVHYYLGITYARKGEYVKCAQHLEEVLNSELAYINKVHTQMILGYIYTIREEYENALDLFRDIIDAGFDNAQAYAAIGFIMDRMGNFKEAVMNLTKAIELDPQNANAHNSLGYIYAEANINLDEALRECELALSLDRNNPAYLDSLGWVYFKLGMLVEAKRYLRKALKKAPTSEEIVQHLRIVTRAAEKGKTSK
jgi:tetratricopeptide (TPR) repeat protein